MGKTAEYFTVILEHYIIYSMKYNENYCEIKVCKFDFMGLFNICEFTQCYLSRQPCAMYYCLPLVELKPCCLQGDVLSTML